MRKPIKCAVCHTNIKDFSNIYQCNFNLGVVCKKCRDNFSENDIELMINLFIAFGGYFGKFRCPKISIENILKELIEEIKIKTSKIGFQELNVKMMHKVLLYGISPQDYIKKLKTIVRI